MYVTLPLQEDPVTTLAEELRSSHDNIIKDLLQKPLSEPRIKEWEKWRKTSEHKAKDDTRAATGNNIRQKPSEPKATKEDTNVVKDIKQNSLEKKDSKVVKEDKRQNSFEKEDTKVVKKDIRQNPSENKDTKVVKKDVGQNLSEKNAKEGTKVVKEDIKSEEKFEVVDEIPQIEIHEPRASIMTQDASVETDTESGVNTMPSLCSYFTMLCCSYFKQFQVLSNK